ncbi:MAG: dihydrofolate reductase [Acholeplasmatales bacterium]|nr:dihydrofolate reductase [Acholeplasmatales bacterium]
MISLIWAMAKNNLIGKDNELPWSYKEDIKYFRNTIKDHAVLVGDRTHESILSYRNGKKFPDVKYYVSTIFPEVNYPDVVMVRDLVKFLEEEHDEEIFVIGGRTIYNISLPYADRLYITFIDKEFDGNVYFPEIDFSKYNLIKEVKGVENPELRFCVFERK